MNIYFSLLLSMVFLLIQKNRLNDNDAAGRKYTNFTKKAGLLEKIRHVNAKNIQSADSLGE